MPKKKMVKQNRKSAIAQLRSSTEKPIALEGTMLLFGQKGGLCVRVWFEVVANLAVDIFLGASFVHRYIRGLFCSEKKVVAWHSSPVLIIARN